MLILLVHRGRWSCPWSALELEGLCGGRSSAEGAGLAGALAGGADPGLREACLEQEDPKLEPLELALLEGRRVSAVILSGTIRSWSRSRSALSAVGCSKGITAFGGGTKRDGCTCVGMMTFSARCSDAKVGLFWSWCRCAFRRSSGGHVAILHRAPSGWLSSCRPGHVALRPAAVMTDILESILLRNRRTIVGVTRGGNFVLGSITEFDHFTKETTIFIFHLVPMLARAERSAAEAVESLKRGLLPCSLLRCCSCCPLFLLLFGLSGFSSSREVGKRSSTSGSRIGGKTRLDSCPRRTANIRWARSSQRGSQSGILKTWTSSAVS